MRKEIVRGRGKNRQVLMDNGTEALIASRINGNRQPQELTCWKLGGVALEYSRDLTGKRLSGLSEMSRRGERVLVETTSTRKRE